MYVDKKILEIPVKDIIPNRNQPRVNFDEDGLNELIESIKQFGIIQPLVVRKQNDKYEIIAGERRYKAAMQAGLQTVPVILSEMTEEQSAEVALTENIHRRNLSVIEEAKSMKNLLDRGYLTQEQLATKMGVSQRTIVDKLQLLELDEEIQEALLNAKISERHAKSLLGLEKQEQKKWLNRIINERMNVRDLEFELKKMKNGELVEEDLIPLVEINPNIENIVNNAEDIKITRAPHDVASFLIPEGGKQEEHKTTFVIPDPPDKIPNKFFNFLEDEEANMNVPDSEEIMNIFNQSTTPLAEPIEILEDKTEKNEVENMEETTISNFEVKEPTNLSINETVGSNLAETNANSLNLNNDFNRIENSIEIQSNPIIETTDDFIQTDLIQNEKAITPETNNFETILDSFTPINDNNASEPITLERINPIEEQSIQNKTFSLNDLNQNDSIKINSNEGILIPEPEIPNDNIEPINNQESSNVDTISPFKSIFFKKEEEEEESINPTFEASNNGIEEVLPINDEPLVDPLDSIVTLEPDYAARQEEQAGTDLKTAINKIRNTISDLELSGFNIELEEADLEDQYYFNIKIIK